MRRWKMQTNMTRRAFFRIATESTAAAAALGSPGLATHATAFLESAQNKFRGELKKSIDFRMLQKDLSTMEKFKISKRAGFDGIEIQALEDPAQYDEFNEAAQASGLRIHSVMNKRNWTHPLSSADPEVVRNSLAGIEMALRTARAVRADTMLLVPAVVNEETSYKDAYVRSQNNIRRMIPLARELNIIIAVENVWNRFLLSPLEFKRYVEEFDSPFVKAYFDVGNIVIYGFPQDWIRTLGELIVKVHIKDFDNAELIIAEVFYHVGKTPSLRAFKNLGEGSINWREVRRALSDIGYSGFINAELRAGDPDYLRDVCIRMDKIISGDLL